jgi:type I restriction enzyme M protein
LTTPSSLRAHCSPTSQGSTPGAFETFQRFNFDEQITRLDEADLLYLVIGKFADIDLHPGVVSNLQSGVRR